MTQIDFNRKFTELETHYRRQLSALSLGLSADLSDLNKQIIDVKYQIAQRKHELTCALCENQDVIDSDNLKYANEQAREDAKLDVRGLNETLRILEAKMTTTRDEYNTARRQIEAEQKEKRAWLKDEYKAWLKEQEQSTRISYADVNRALYTIKSYFDRESTTKKALRLGDIIINVEIHNEEDNV